MASIGATNLNDTPSAGKLTEADLPSAPRIPRQREVSWPGLALLAAGAASAAGFGWLALLAFFS